MSDLTPDAEAEVAEQLLEIAARRASVPPHLLAEVRADVLEERAHRRAIERRTAMTSLGCMVFAHVVAAAFVIGSLLLAWYALDKDYEIAGTAALISAVVPIVLTMLGRRSQEG